MSLLKHFIYSTLHSMSLAASCYYTDGTYGSPEQQPCFPGQDVSACCGIAKTNGDANDYCLTSGLCLGQVSGYTGLMLLNSCTDRTWGSDDCPSICPQSVEASFGIHVLPCLNESNSHWCCSIDGSDCCGDAFELDIGTLMFPDEGATGNWTSPTSVVNPPTSTRTSTGGSVESTTSSDQATATVTVTASPNSDSNSDSTDSTSASDKTCDTGACPDNKITVVSVGVGLGVALVLSLASSVGAFCFQRRVFKKRLEGTRASFLAAGYIPAPYAHAELYAGGVPSRPPIAELSAKPRSTLFEM
ncbi:hypothetical protein BJX99DRAFT_250814 [Aspergillus californicus]